jgi:hypothetical protein
MQNQATADHNGNGNGHTLSPSEKAWQTARNQAVEKATGPFYDQLDVETRALCDRNLPHGAARLFCLIAKLSWKPEVGGKYRGRIGSLCISARKLAKIMAGSNVKSFFRKTKRNPKTKQIVSQQEGWIEALVAGGYLWTAKCAIRNIPEDKWQNVYNVACHVPRVFTPELGLLESVDIAEEESPGYTPVPRNGNREFLGSEVGGNGQSPENGTDSPPKRALPVPRNGNGQSPEMGIASPPKRALPVPRNGNGLSPETVTASPPKRALPVPRNGNGQSPETVYKGKTGEGTTVQETIRGGGEAGEPPRESFAMSFKTWQEGLTKLFPRELRETLKDLTDERAKLKELAAQQSGAHGKPGPRTLEQIERLTLKVDAVKTLLHGPK